MTSTTGNHPLPSPSTLATILLRQVTLLPLCCLSQMPVRQASCIEPKTRCTGSYAQPKMVTHPSNQHTRWPAVQCRPPDRPHTCRPPGSVTDDDRRRQMTDSSEQNNTGPLGRPVIRHLHWSS